MIEPIYVYRNDLQSYSLLLQISTFTAYVMKTCEEKRNNMQLLLPQQNAHFLPIESGPYIEAFKARKIEVLYLYEPIDEFVMNHARAFEEKNFDKKPFLVLLFIFSKQFFSEPFRADLRIYFNFVAKVGEERQLVAAD